ncbi:RNA-guided endonuclease InsQ/TnpB family protein, partial [Photorhabdus temperata]|uniref:RNA-guided endonuclease InsQ/TnpB family protein n=1 Tax=Photorhabdus temperata TaxID=574560 RepID=UPI002F2B38F3
MGHGGVASIKHWQRKRLYGNEKMTAGIQSGSSILKNIVSLKIAESGCPSGLGWIKFRQSQEVNGKIKNATISQSAGKWYVSFQVEIEASEPHHESTTMVGLDAGISKLATLSDGTIYEPVNSFKTRQRKLAKLQRQLSRKVKFSANWQKQKRKIQRLHSHIANIRRDYLHKTTTKISKNHAMIVIEDLKVSNMSKSAKGTAEQPGRNVRAKSGLNRAIRD